jgi:hypothetical protein
MDAQPGIATHLRKDTNALEGGMHSVNLAQMVNVRNGMWPTPAARDYRDGGAPADLERNTPNLPTAVLTVAKSLPTPTASRRTGLQSHGRTVVGGQLNPTWVEWLMGWPLEWTALEPLATESFRQWQREHGKS